MAPIVLAGLVLWLATGSLADARIERRVLLEREEASRSAETIAANIRLSLGHIGNIPTVIASQDALETLLEKRFGPDVVPSPLPIEERARQWRNDPELATLSRRLSRLVVQKGIGVNAIWVMNAAGDGIAVGVPPGEADYTGYNYAWRDYFQAALRGENGRMFAVGLVSGEPALYFTSPVFASGRVVGAVGVRVPTSTLAYLLEPDAFLTDENDVIVLARDPALMMQTLPNPRVAALSADERMKRYRTNDFKVLPIHPAKSQGVSGLLEWGSRKTPYLLASSRQPGDLLTVHVLHDLEEIATLRRDRLWLFAILSMTGLLMIAVVGGIALYLRGSRAHARALAALNDDLAIQARTDALTGCANRRYFLAALDEERSRSARYGRPFSVLSLDLDHFKRINDRLGHPGGDRALRHFVAVIQSDLRPSDLLGRLGGEEFAVLLPETDIVAATGLAERLRAAIATTPLPEPDSIAMTVSIGVAQWWVEDEERADELLSRADRALYAAKQGGRNRIEQA